MQTQRNAGFENVRFGDAVHGFSLNPEHFPEINEMIETLFPKWQAWQKERTPHMKVGKSDFLRFALVRGLLFTESQIKEEINVAA